MAANQETDDADEVGTRTSRDPAVLAAVGSVLLSWHQFYVRGNREHGLFIGLWAPTILAFSNAVRLNDIREQMAGKAGNLVDRLTSHR